MGVAFKALVTLTLLQGVHAVIADTESLYNTAPVEDGHDEKARELRNGAIWGRMYVRNGLEPIQYFKDKFESVNAEIPFDQSKLFFPEDMEGCSEYGDDEVLEIKQEPTIVVVNRGTCRFEQKTHNAQEAGAVAVVLVSTSEDVMRPPASAGFEGKINMVMIRKSAGEQLRAAAERGNVYTFLVPMVCSKEKKETHCDAVTEYERHIMDDQIRGGFVVNVATDEEIGEFVTASYGGPLKESGIYDIAVGNPGTGCTELQNAEEVTGKAVIFDRGECKIIEKAITAQAAGAVAMIIVNDGYLLHHPSVSEAWEGYNITIPTIMINIKTLGEIMGWGEVPQEVETIGLVFDNEVADAWDEITAMEDPASWPKKSDEKEEKLANALIGHFLFDDRVQSIKGFFLSAANGLEKDFQTVHKRVAIAHEKYRRRHAEALENSNVDTIQGDIEKLHRAEHGSKEALHDEL